MALLIDYALNRPRKWFHTLAWKKKIRPDSLVNFEKKIFSQNGEDGILEEICRRIPTLDRSGFFVEFGVEDGSECCCRHLVEKYGWNGLFMDGCEKNVAAGTSLFSKYSGVSFQKAFITRENIVSLLQAQNCPKDFDLLVVDIDGNDYHVLSEILKSYSPEVLVVEYNGKWPPPKEWVMPYDANFIWDGSAYFGASLEAFYRLLKNHDYLLIGCCSRGNNAFFIKRKYSNLFPLSTYNAGFHYVPPDYGAGFGSPYRSRSKAHLNRACEATGRSKNK